MPRLKDSKKLLLFALLFLAPVRTDAASSQTPFYAGKTITIIQGRAPGGFGDMRVRSLVPYLQKNIPGNPTVVVEFMPGTGGRKAANYIYQSAKPDGLTIGNVGSGLVTNAILGEAGVQYELDKFVFLGSPSSGDYHAVFMTKREAGLDTLSKLRSAKSLRIGSHAVGHSSYTEGRLFAYFLDLKDAKLVTGYSGPEIDIAIAQGELDARTQSADTVMQRNREWVDKGLMHFHAVFQVPKEKKHPVFAHLPEIETFARSAKERGILAMLRAFRIMGAPFILPPGTDKNRADILKEAMRKTLKDPAFHKEYKKLTGDDALPLMPEESQKVVAELPRDTETVAFFKLFVGPDPLPAR